MNESSSAIIDMRDLRKVYSGWSWSGRNTIEAVRGVTLQVRAGEVFGLLGPNGAGKTTLIKMLLGVVQPSSGEATMFGRQVGSYAARARVGYLPESLRVDRHHTARSALRFYGQMSRMSGGEIQRRSDELLELVGLRGRDRESVRRFSKGMYQRLGLAQALMHDPDLLIMDEPTDGLDPVGRNEIRRVIQQLRETGKAIFLNSHILQEVELVCTRVAILSKGEIRAVGRLNELAGREDADRVTIEISPQAMASAAFVSPAWPREAELRALAERIEVTDLKIEIATGRQRIEARVSDQAKIDALVDWLRQHQFSIQRLQIQRPTLEETFMKLVGETDQVDVDASSHDAAMLVKAP